MSREDYALHDELPPVTPTLAVRLSDDVLREAIEAADPEQWINGEWRYSPSESDFAAMRAVLVAALTPEPVTPPPSVPVLHIPPDIAKGSAVATPPTPAPKQEPTVRLSKTFDITSEKLPTLTGPPLSLTATLRESFSAPADDARGLATLLQPDYVCTLERLPNDAQSLMKFTLIYDGELPPDNRSRPIAPTKAAIRRQLDPQLRELWRTNKALEDFRDQTSYRSNNGPEAIAAEYRFGDNSFVPLIRRANGMFCTLELLVLVRQLPFHSTFAEGDLDSRIKTLIDGLKSPSQPGEHPSDLPETLYCLMDDDDRITQFSVRMDQLLAPKREEQKGRDVVAVISVEILNAGPIAVGLGVNPFALQKVR